MVRALPSLTDFPIPRDVTPGPGWSAQMREMAAHIGAYDTLAISEAYGGQEIYIPADSERNPFLGLVGVRKAKTLTHVYRRETIAIPTAGYAIARARRAAIIAAVHAGHLTVTDAAKVMGVRRDYASRLVNHSGEGVTAAPARLRSDRRDPRQLDMFG